jgi:hypothetical protein
MNGQLIVPYKLLIFCMDQNHGGYSLNLHHNLLTFLSMHKISRNYIAIQPRFTIFSPHIDDGGDISVYISISHSLKFIS